MHHKTNYHIRILLSSGNLLENFFDDNNIEYILLSSDFGNEYISNLYSVDIDDQSALALKLKFSLLGFLDVKTTLNSLKRTTYRCGIAEVVLK